MKTHRYVLLLGTSLASPLVLERAIESLAVEGLIEAASRRVSGPSISAGDARHFHNQAVVLATALTREALPARLKQIEAALGRTPNAPDCVIDIDLACECDGHGIVLWRDDRKLGHALFLDLMQDVLDQLRGSHL